MENRDLIASVNWGIDLSLPRDPWALSVLKAKRGIASQVALKRQLVEMRTLSRGRGLLYPVSVCIRSPSVAGQCLVTRRNAT